MSGVLCAQTGGLPNYLGSATVTVGYFSTSGGGTTADFWGFPNAGATPGSISPSTWASSGLVIDDFDYRVITISSPYSITQRLIYGVTGYAPNTGWTTLTVAGTGYNRADASYSYDGTRSVWAWDASGTGNPFGTTTGATKAVSWS